MAGFSTVDLMCLGAQFDADQPLVDAMSHQIGLGNNAMMHGSGAAQAIMTHLAATKMKRSWLQLPSRYGEEGSKYALQRWYEEEMPEKAWDTMAVWERSEMECEDVLVLSGSG